VAVVFAVVNKFSVTAVTNLQSERLAVAIAALGTELAPANKGKVAEKAGMSKQVLSGLLHGKRRLTPHLAGKLAPVLKVTPGYLLGNTEFPTEAAS
jgi:transcriptional regulator with XRE-family HTH domain